MVALIYSNSSLRDIENIKEFISNDSVSSANRFIKSIRERITLLKQHPEIGIPVYPERFKNLRRLLFKSYRIIYQYTTDKVIIITVHHQSRLIENVQAIKEYKE
jgi:toxin ParE1/3/4